ncbi:MAG TPA: 3-deoxy-manno-octulosonate cytidylyltransferase [bacterium]|jgi:3-deoxy-manno-octulosonate cytidylyltransferase (CMP-KDO synthetase)
MTSVSVIIPARYAARRFPGKILYPIHGKPLVLWVIEGASKAESVSDVIVATDDTRIFDVVSDAGHDVRMTREDHQSGTDRVWEVAENLDTEWVLNLQGDEPLITPDVIDSFVQESITGETEMATLVRKLDSSEADDPNRVKVVTSNNMDALYFSRSRIPYPRNVKTDQGDTAEYWLHIGVYLYRRDVLEKFVGLKMGELEKVEGLEQLRALENGIKIKCVATSHEFLGVDSPDDVARVEKALESREL